MDVRKGGVHKTYKLYIGGEFVRSESGRAYRVDGAVNVPRGSRKDLRDAISAARKAFPGWAERTAMNRGQVLYRAAEMLDGRRAQFVEVLGGGRAAEEIATIEKAAADNVKRVVKIDAAEQSPQLITAFMELKTVWHPIGV